MDNKQSHQSLPRKTTQSKREQYWHWSILFWIKSCLLTSSYSRKSISQLSTLDIFCRLKKLWGFNSPMFQSILNYFLKSSWKVPSGIHWVGVLQKCLIPLWASIFACVLFWSFTSPKNVPTYLGKYVVGRVGLDT